MAGKGAPEAAIWPAEVNMVDTLFAIKTEKYYHGEVHEPCVECVIPRGLDGSRGHLEKSFNDTVNILLYAAAESVGNEGALIQKI